MRKYFFCFFSAFLFLATSVYAARTSNRLIVPCSLELRGIVSTIQKVPDAKKLIETIQEEGQIRIVVNKGSVLREFGAFWDPDTRTIAVNMDNRCSKGEVIGSILFELHNALVNSKLAQYYEKASQGKITREDYVRGIEYLEYQNSHAAAQLATKGIKMGMFPRSARLPTYSNFEEHFYVQQMAGHSDWVGYTYDQMAPVARPRMPRKMAACKMKNSNQCK